MLTLIVLSDICFASWVLRGVVVCPMYWLPFVQLVHSITVCNISGGHLPISIHLSGMATQINTWAVIVSWRCSGKFMVSTREAYGLCV